LWTSRQGNSRYSLNQRSASWATNALPCTVRTDNALKVSFSATLGEEPDVDVELA
jgi:hypothetical protein